MTIDKKLLPQRVKFRKFEKHSTRAETLAMSLPQNQYAPTYINAHLARYLANRDCRRVFIYTDPEEEAIALEPTTSNDGFAVVPTGDRGRNLTAKLRKIMPCGRYVYQPDESSDKLLVFRRELVTFKGKKNVSKS